MKRIFLFILTNIMVMTTISIVLAITGVGHWMTAQGNSRRSVLYGAWAALSSLSLSLA